MTSMTGTRTLKNQAVASRLLFALYAAAAVSAAPQSGSTITVSSASSAPATTVTSTIVPSSATSAGASISSAVSASAHKFTGASTFAGAATSFVYPPPGATGTSLDTFFPGPDEVGHFGATPTGDEAFVIQTAPVAPLKQDAYPLVTPQNIHEPQAPPANVDAHTSASEPFVQIRSWGNLSPWWSLGGGAWGLTDASETVPAGCELTQVHLVHRHGARYPTSGSAPARFANTLHAAANSTGFTAEGPLAFLNTWTYKLGAEILTPFGRQQLYDLGVAFRVKYGNLLHGFTDLPVFRTTSEERMVDSALNFAAGFFGVQQYQTSYHQLIMIEDAGFYNPLAPWPNCPNSKNQISELGPEAQTNWTQVYLKDAVKRLQKDIKGVQLDVADVFAMQQLCAYETVALGYSAFCALFTEEEWLGFEYSNDLSFWYGNGPGQPSAAAQSVGYAQELIARLTQTPLTNFTATTTNATLDSSNVTFPLNQPIYIDATHDTVLSTITVTLNFTSMTAAGPLPVDHIQKGQTYKSSHVAPFAANLVGQVMTCPMRSSHHTSSSSSSSSSSKPQTAQYIRFLLNDGVLPLDGLAPCPADADGLCAVDTFVSGLHARIAEIDYEYDCFGNYTAPWPDPIIDGRMVR